MIDADTASDEDDDGCLRDSEVALMGALKTVFELLLTAGVTPAQIDKLLASQQKIYAQDPVMPRAVFVMQSLRDFVLDAGRAEHREQVRQILREPPAGSA
jgi:hypothetical protein